MEEVKSIREFLIANPVLKLTHIEEELKFPKLTIIRIRNGERNSLSKHRLNKLVTYLEKYGFSLQKIAA